MNDGLAFLRAHASEMLSDLRQLVEIESPSDDPNALEQCAVFLAHRAADLAGATVRRINDAAGPHLDLVVGDAPPRILLLGHFDTVWPIGTLAERPFRVDGGRAYGPGSFDMKAGLVQGLWAIRALRETAGERDGIRLFFNSDEETGSTRSRSLIESAARDASVVFVLEPSTDGALKTARKGTAKYEISIHGRAAHAGVDPDAGSSAILELASVIMTVNALADRALGTTVNVGVVRGGTRANVVAEEAYALVDVRIAVQSEASRVDRALADLGPSIAGTSISVRGGISRPPMPRTSATAKLFESARAVGRTIGLELTETSTGGASDGNFCAAAGTPVLDGLGAVGGGAHAVDEHIFIEAMAQRAALVAGIIQVYEPGAAAGGGGL